MKYSAWGKDGCDFLFIKGDEMSPQQAQLNPGMQLLNVFEAHSWNDAMRQYHEWQGWEPYKPIGDANGNEHPEDSTLDSELPEIQSQGAVMSVKKEANGRRSVQVETEVPGTPEEVWQAIATGPGVSSWFVPTEMEEADGKTVAVKSNFGPGLESRAVMTAWDPPRMFAAESPGWTPEMPPMATEWSVEAKAGGTCIVRVVHSLFTDKDDWDNQLEGTEHGWPGFFRTLRIYLTHFRGQRSALMQKMTVAAGTEAEAWETLTTAMELKGLSVGQRWSSPAGVPALGGVVEHATQSPNDILVRLDTPGPGVAALGTYNCGPIMVGVNLYLYGDAAAANVARESPLWQAWIQERFPSPAEPGKGE